MGKVGRFRLKITGNFRAAPYCDEVHYDDVASKGILGITRTLVLPTFNSLVVFP